MTFWIANWLRVFAITVFLELLVAIPLLRCAEPGLWRRASAVLIANLASHPIVWFVFPGATLGFALRFWLSESWAVGVEVLVYLVIWPHLDWRRACLISLAANGFSVLIGFALQALQWIP